MAFKKEADFEEALIESLKDKGWGKNILKYPTEEDLIKNWADILFENNRGKDRLNDVSLSKGEMAQIIEQVQSLRTPLKLNGFINGKSILIKRDNPADKEHFGKDVSLKIYDRQEIAAGNSRYQIAQQPVFKAKNPMLNDRRGDFMLLINGMPVIHVELKKTGVSVSQAREQIKKYAHEGVFTGIFSLVQIFVCMNPEEAIYFANPGPDGAFNERFEFHWEDVNNEPINDWRDVAEALLSIPMAHQMIGFYTVADTSDGVLKVMRSYQYHAANAISDRVSTMKWDEGKQRGGYIWHTTGSGKTMTSFKSAQLIANSKDADKVVFLMDRVELGTQSLYEYRAFADETDEIQATESTRVLIDKLKSDKPSDTLIVTSIQKMSRIEEDEGGLNSYDIETMNSKRIVFIVDEAHRSTFGEMLVTVKKTFPNAVFFGFTGTPIYDKNKKKDSTTATVFGDELHRYTIADGIRDGNVLGFDPYKVCTYRDRDLRKAVALKATNSKSEAEVFADEKKKAVYLKYMEQKPMAGYYDENGKYIRGIEDEIKKVQYDCDEHRNMVVKDILEQFHTISQGGKFHGIFATSSIPEAIKYYRIIKQENPDLKVTVLFDSNIDNTDNDDNEGPIFKEDGLVEILEDYNRRYGQNFTIKTHDLFKKDVSARLSHKRPYERIEKEPEEQLDLLIVVNQMLTGFDSKWVNVLYLDKLLKYENVIQSFSRTNRLFGSDKPFGIIRYYRYPNTMERNIEEAVEYYSGDRELDLFVDKLPKNLEKMSYLEKEIEDLFIASESTEGFEKLPDDPSEKARFAKLFSEFNKCLEAAKVQGFSWEKKEYEFESKEVDMDSLILDEEKTLLSIKEPEISELKDSEDMKENVSVSFGMTEEEYLILVQRYKELIDSKSDDGKEPIPFDIDGYITEIDTGKIDTDYMNSRFEKYLEDLSNGNVSEEELNRTLNELHKAFASLTQEEQKFANIFLHDVERGEADLEEGKPFRDYITDYQMAAKNKQILDLHEAIGVDVEKVEKFFKTRVTERNINEYGRLNELEKTIDLDKASAYFEQKTGKPVPKWKVNREATMLLRDFILQGGFDIFEENN